MPRKFTQLLMKLENIRPKNYVSASLFLLDTDDETRTKIDKNVKSMEKRLSADNQSHSMTMIFKSNALTLICISKSYEYSTLKGMVKKHVDNSGIQAETIIAWKGPLETSDFIRIWIYPREDFYPCKWFSITDFNIGYMKPFFSSILSNPWF